MTRRIAFVCIFALLVAGAACGQNLVQNGDFETGQEPWNRPVTDAEAHSGEHSIVLDNSEAVNWAAVAYGPTVPLKPNTPYRISVWLTRETGDGYLEIGGYPVDANDERLRTGRSWQMVLFPIRVMTGSGLGRWQHFENTFIIRRPDLAGLKLRLIHRNASDVIYFDDVVIEEVDLPPRPEWAFPDGVLFPGRPSEFGMKVESAGRTGDGVRVVTTGAEYRFSDSGEIILRQRINRSRDVVSVRSEQPFGELSIERQDHDVCVIRGDDLAFGVQGDSLICLATNRALDLTLTSQVGAKHLVSQGPHLLAVDEDGGWVVSEDWSKRYETVGCKLSDPPEETGEPGWSVQYSVGERERVALAAFPPREYRWNDAFNKRLVNVTGLIEDDTIRFYRDYCSVLLLMDAGRLYDESRTPVEGRGPYEFLDPAGMRRLVDTCHSLDMQVMCYSNTSAEGRLWFGDDSLAYFNHLREVTEAYDLDGWYFDGVFTHDPWSEAYVHMRRVRDLVGEDGVIYNHCTLNPPLNRDDFYLPFIDAYATYLLRGEGQAIRGVNDPYMRWVINSYRISNAIPTLKWDKMESASTRDIFRAMLGFHGRFRWAYPTVPVDDNAWGGQPPERAALDAEFFTWYFPELDRREVLWRYGQLDTSIHWPLEHVAGM